MPKHKSLAVFLTVLFFMFFSRHASSCSMYKITLNGKTMVGSNYDAYYLTTKIWFKKGNTATDYGAVFSGARLVGSDFLPQSGMNEAGLTFSRLAAPPPEKESLRATNKKAIVNPVSYLEDILHTCRTVDEVKDYIHQYDYSFFSNEVSIYVDKSGRYLIVEPDTMTIGNDANYVLSNFCPSTTDPASVKQVRYLNGVAFLKNKADTGIAFCTALSDTMHVCRKKMGDGTLLTSIRDLNEGIIYLNFYHDYRHQIKFNLKEELAKGNHMYEVPGLFPENAEYEKLKNFRTPQNNSSIEHFFMFCIGLFLFSSIFFAVSFFRNIKKPAEINGSYNSSRFLLFILSIILIFYILALVRNENIFYFPAPYKDYVFSLLNIAAYIPFLMLLLIVPLFRVNFKIIKRHSWRNFSSYLFALNNLAYLTLIILFAYWGLFNIFN